MENKNIGILCKKIEAIALMFDGIQKGGENKFSNYKYISYEQVDAVLRTAFTEKGISILPSVLSLTEEFTTNDKGKPVVRTIVNMEFTIVDHETGASIKQQFSCAEQDTGGKSAPQAITQCVKYFYFKLFRITDEGIVDADSKTTTSGHKEKYSAWYNRSDFIKDKGNIHAAIMKRPEGERIKYAQDIVQRKKDSGVGVSNEVKALIVNLAKTAYDPNSYSQ